MTEAKFVLTLDPTPLSRFGGYQRPCPASALVIVSSEDQAFRQCVRAGDRHWGPGGDVSEPIRFWRPVTFGEARRLFDGRTVTGLAYRDGFVVMEPQWASALPVRCVDAQSQPEPIVSKAGGGFILNADKVFIDGKPLPPLEPTPEAQAAHDAGRGWPAEDPVQALGLTDPGDVFERPGAALRRLFWSETTPFVIPSFDADMADLDVFWAHVAKAFMDHIGHGATPAPTDLPMDGNAPTYREIAVQALRAMDEAAGFSERDAPLLEAHTRLSALLEGADAAVAQGVTDQMFATDAPPEEAKPELATDNGARITTDADGHVTGVHLSGLVFTNAEEPRTARYVRPFPPAPSTLHRPGSEAYDTAMERLVLELARRVQTMEQR